MVEVCNKNKNTNNLMNQLMAYESDEMSEDEEIKFFQELINTGMVWSLQGHYGRVAMSMIETGLCHAKEA